jgi:hypothetical protein
MSAPTSGNGGWGFVFEKINRVKSVFTAGLRDSWFQKILRTQEGTRLKNSALLRDVPCINSPHRGVFFLDFWNIIARLLSRGKTRSCIPQRDAPVVDGPVLSVAIFRLSSVGKHLKTF